VTDRILVFIPCYNCERQIGRVLAQFHAIPAGVFAEILVVDNGSRDGTVRAATEALPGIACCPSQVVRNSENYNLGGSHKAAFAHAERNGFTHVLVLHGDDQGNIADILPLLRDGGHRTHDACLGSRFMRGSNISGYSRFRIVGNLVFNGVFSVALRRRVVDLGSGLNIFGRAVFSDQRHQTLPDDLHFNPYLLVSMIDRGRRIMFFPISWREDDQVSNVKMASQALKTLAAAREYVLDRGRLRSGEHRTTPRTAYTFTTVARHDPGDGAGAPAPGASPEARP
jgi:dolichol-phosphate mannosyltransferase